MFKYRRAIVSAIAGLLVFSLLAGVIVMVVSAKTSSEIQSEINALQQNAEQLAEDRDALEKEISANRSQTLTIVEQKAQVDREIDLTRREVENVNAQVHQYNLLISEKQAELDELEAEQDALFDSYKLRMRVMQERGEISRWAVIFQADSFSDMLNCRAMIEEIAKADQRMMDEMRELASTVLAAKDALAEEKLCLEEKKAELSAAQTLLEEKRTESDELLAQLLADKEELLAEADRYEAQEAELSDRIAALEQERTEALRKEWEAAHPPQTGNDNNNNNNTGSTEQPETPGDSDDSSDVGDSDAEAGSGTYPGTNETFLFPTAAGTVLTSPYGYRTHPLTGNYTMHNGVDLANNSGTPIYATKSGCVTTAAYNYAYGYYVTINHMDGYSSLYGHMTNYIVSEGQYVTRGEVIGYMGSTGWSTGPHLHFTIYYNGATVNPMNYISLP